jgi:hypothetical protein
LKVVHIVLGGMVMPSLLCVVAHPDDETMLCGGLLALLASRGVKVDILSLTRGEGGETGEPPRCSRAELGAVFLDQKEAAALCHATQNALFVRRRSQEAGHPITVREALLTEEAVHRQWPTTPAADDVLLKWLGKD